MNIYNLPFHYEEIQVIKNFILESSKNQPLNAANYTIIAPNILAKQLLIEAFLTHNSESVILPKVIPISDTTTLLESSLKFPNQKLFLKINALLHAKTISSNKRAFLLAKLLRAKDKNLSSPEAISLAFDLAQTLDGLNTENISLEQLKTTSMESPYGKELFGFLELANHHWHEILNELNLTNIFDKTSKALSLYAQNLQLQPLNIPETIIIFGINNYFNSMIELLTAIASHPQGLVIFSGIDFGLPEKNWQNLPKTHPQFQMAEILKRMKISRLAVKNLNADYKKEDFFNKGIKAITKPFISERTNFLHRAFDEIPYNKFNKEALQNGLTNLSCFIANSEDEEAKVIALLIKKELTLNPHQDINIITTNLDLTKKITFELSKWHIATWSSYGTLLTNCNTYNFFKLIAAVNPLNLNVINLLGLLKHPLYTNNITTKEFSLETIYWLDLYLLREGRPLKTLENLIALNNDLLDTQKINKNQYLELQSLLTSLEDNFKDLAVFNGVKFNFKEGLIKHIKVAEQLSGIANATSKIWLSHEGQILSSGLKNILEDAENIEEVSLSEYMNLLETLLNKYTLKDNNIGAPVKIYGIIQAHFSSANLNIICDLNEESFPITPSPSIWLSALVTKALNLPEVIESIGGSAYIFSKLCAGNKVVLTRSLKKQGNITTPSRFLVKLLNTITANGLTLNNQELLEINEITSLLSTKSSSGGGKNPLKFTLKFPNPPTIFRPSVISVTAIEKLLKNPYVFYVENVLKIKPLNPINTGFPPNIYGNIVHKSLDRLFKKYNSYSLDTLTASTITEDLITIINKELAVYMHEPEIAIFWRKRLFHLAKELGTHLSLYLKNIKNIKTEIKGEILIEFLDKKNIIIKGYPDHIAIKEGGIINIIDYKTGNPTYYTPKSIKNYHKQLILLAYMARHQAFNLKIASPAIEALEYWFFPKLTKESITVKNIASILKLPDIEAYIEDSFNEIRETLQHYLLSLNPFPLNMEDKLLSKDYKHLVRKDIIVEDLLEEAPE